jgi:2-amino-4-hydroxy-6-hydroxymethyldihydropteridine diphosphokinase
MNVRRKNLAYLSLGSNIDPEFHLPAAVRLLSERGAVRRLSRAWQSVPYGFAEQPDFVNAAVLLETPLDAERILTELIPEVERYLDRQRDPTNKNGPRTIDIDLSLYNHEVTELAGKWIPDPSILERLFVARPLADIDPFFRHPRTGETLAAIAARLAGREPPLTLRADIFRQPVDGQPVDGQAAGAAME